MRSDLTFRFDFRCFVCGRNLVWTNDLGSQPQDNGDEVFAIDVQPHTCDVDELKEQCMEGDKLNEEQFAEVLQEASQVGLNA